MPCKTQAISVCLFVGLSAHLYVCLSVCLPRGAQRGHEGLRRPVGHGVLSICPTISPFYPLRASEAFWGSLRLSQLLQGLSWPFWGSLRTSEAPCRLQPPLPFESIHGLFKVFWGPPSPSEHLGGDRRTDKHTDGQMDLRMNLQKFRNYSVSYRTSFKRNMNGAMVILLWLWAIFCHFPNNLSLIAVAINHESYSVALS